MQDPTQITDTQSEEPISVLIVDDRPENLELLVQILKEQGYSARPALSAQVALGAVVHNRPDLIILDIRMPDMDGFELCKKLKTNYGAQDIPIIFISALEDVDEKIKAFQVGGVDYITRPFQKEEVLARVQTHLNLNRMNRQMESLVQKRTRQLLIKTEQLEQEVRARQAATDKLRASEQNYRFIIENINEVFWIGSPDWNEIYYISPAYETVWGQSRQSLYDNPRSWIDTVHSEDIDKIMGIIPPAFDKNQSILVFPEYRIQKPDGKTRWISARAFAIRDKKGEVFRIAGIAEDITEKIQSEEKKRQIQKMEAIGTLAGGIAHDLNNILGIVIGNTELAVDDLSEDHLVQNNLDEIKLASLRARDVIRQLLDFCQPTGLRKGSADLVAVIEETLKLIRASIPATIDIIEEINTDTGMVMADHNQLQQLLIILATNAFKAMEEGGGNLTIRLDPITLNTADAQNHPELTPGPYLVLTISDTGVGIAPQIRDKIFDPYFTTRKTGQGSGMGLAVAHGIVKNLEGCIEVESQVGNGSAFQIYLPATDGSCNSQESVWQTGESIPTGHESVLFIDDEMAICKTSHSTLKRLGYRVTIENDPHKALNLFQSHPNGYDLIITDMTMPKMTGEELSQKILETRPGMPIIICTGHSEHMDQHKALDMGIYHYAQKPLVKHEIAGLIRSAIDGQQGKIRYRQ